MTVVGITPRAALAVRLTTANGDKHITRRLRDVSSRTIVPGGYASATLTFDQPLSVNDPCVALYGKVYIYDARHGGTVWEGRQEDPGRGASADGQIWTLTAFGPAVHVEDNPLAVCYVETNVESFHKSTTLGIQSQQVSLTDDDPPQVLLAINNQQSQPTGVVVGAISRLMQDLGQKLARVKATWSCGVTDTEDSVSTFSRASMGGTATLLKTATLNTSGGTLTAVITTDIPSGDDIVDLRIRHTAAPDSCLDDVHWVSASMVLQGTRYNATGTEQTSGATYSSDTVTSDQVVNDLLGRILTQYDGALASVTAGTTNIDQLCYTDPVTAGQILEDLMQLEGSAYFWAAWESTVNGKYRMEWSIWPTTVRYECSIRDNFDSPGDAGELYNHCLVRGRDKNGRRRTVTVTKAQTDLDAAGLARTYVLDLGDAVWSTANATAAGNRFLTDHNYVPNAGTLNVSTPILDLITGRMVAPWEILPGNLIRVRGVLPRVDALNATDRDGVTVFRLTEVEYTASTNTATLTLDSPAKTVENQIVRAHRKVDRRRRR